MLNETAKQTKSEKQLTEDAFESIFKTLFSLMDLVAKGTITAEYKNDLRPDFPVSIKATMTVTYEFTEHEEAAGNV